MAITVTEVQVTWPTAANSISVSASSSQNSETATINAAAFQAQIELKADNAGTPASGDTVEFYLLGALGDPDGTGSNEFASDGHGTLLAILDTNTDDPAIAVVQLAMPLAECQIRAVNNDSGSAVTVSATILEQRG